MNATFDKLLLAAISSELHLKEFKKLCRKTETPLSKLRTDAHWLTHWQLGADADRYWERFCEGH